MSGGMVLVDVSGLADTVMTTNGDLVDFAGGVRARLPIGLEDQLLTVSASGLPNWETAGASGATTNSITTTVTSGFTSTSTSFVAVTGMTLTLSDESGGMALVSCAGGTWENTTADTNCQAVLTDDTVASTTATAVFSGRSVGRYMNALSLTGTFDTDGSVIALYTKVGSGTANFNMGASSQGQIKAFEVY